MMTALGELGESELSKDVNSGRIIQYFGSTNFKGDTGSAPWCSAFVNWCFAANYVLGTQNATAASWCNWGQNLQNKPAFGSVAIQNGHVAFVAGYNADGKIILLGGNQPNVSLWSVSSNTINTYVYPTGYTPNYTLNTYKIPFVNSYNGFHY
jgi:uncharacterized protein (TIGR02594 family)